MSEEVQSQPFVEKKENSIIEVLPTDIEDLRANGGDDTDRATCDEMLHTELAIRAIRNLPSQTLPRTGKCHWCGDDTDGAFCSKECGEDFEKDKRAKSQRPIY